MPFPDACFFAHPPKRPGSRASFRIRWGRRMLVRNRRGFSLTLVTAAALAVPVGAIAWVGMLYLYFGMAGRDTPTVVNVVTFLFSFGLALWIPLREADRPARVVQRSCRLGLGLALLLPAVAFAVLALWEHLPNRPDLGMGGLIIYSAPVMATAAAVVLSLLFLLGHHLASRRLRS